MMMMISYVVIETYELYIYINIILYSALVSIVSSSSLFK